MKQNQWKSILPCIGATVGIFVFSAILFLLYRLSQCLLFQLGGIFLLLLATVNLLLLLFGKELKRETVGTAEAQAPANEEKASDAMSEAKARDEAETDTPPQGPSSPWARIPWKRYAQGGRQAIVRFWARIYRPLQGILLAATLLGGFVWFGAAAWSVPSAETLAYWHLALLVALFVIVIILDKLCKHTVSDSGFCGMLLRNARAFFALTKLILAVTALALTLRLLNIYDIQKYVIYVFTALFYYVGVMILVSLAVRMIRREMTTAPGVVIFLPFLNADIKELALLSFLEENTGITLRSLWSIKYVKSILPYTLLVAALLFWVSTGIVYVQSHQEAAVYRFGSLQEQTLEPGLHLTLPYPLDKSEIYNTKTVNKVTIGYNSGESVDNVWTEAQGDEYRLLLGSGNELVSINLRVEYKIRDLKQYLSVSSAPERLMEAKAYELITDRTINTDLETILSTNRESFANTLHQQLTDELKQLGIGLEVVNVIMESIHPPVEVAQVYQAFIGAEIDAERLILDAQARALVTVAEAQSEARDRINIANVDYYQKVSTAKTEIAEFMAAVEASNAFPDEYAYYKYLEAIGTAYQKSKLIIVGNGVDGTRLYFGNINS